MLNRLIPRARTNIYPSTNSPSVPTPNNNNSYPSTNSPSVTTPNNNNSSTSISNTNTMYIDSTNCVTDLCTIGGKMNTDKSPFAMNSVCCLHRKGYTAVYTMLLSQYKNKNINFAEIGIEACASLNTWTQFFSDSCNIYAFEYDKSKIENCKRLDLSNVTYVETDVGDISILNSSFANTGVLFDVIIDDSTHWLEHQNNVIKNVAQYIKPGGMLIIEDIMRDTDISKFDIDTNDWCFYTFIVCDHKNRFNPDNDKILYLIKK